MRRVPDDRKKRGGQIPRRSRRIFGEKCKIAGEEIEMETGSQPVVRNPDP